MVDLLTTIIVTHYSPKPSYGELAPPSAGIVRETIKSMRDNLIHFDQALAQDPILIYNAPRQPSPGSKRYRRNLNDLSDERDLTFVTKENNGLRDALLEGLNRSRSRYILFLEHDWIFTENIDISALLDTFEDNELINYVRFNKRENRTNGWDTYVEQDDSMNIPLCRVSSFSNNPHIARRDVYQEWIEESAPDFKFLFNYLRSVNGGIGIFWSILKNKIILRKPQVRGYDNVEYPIDFKYKEKIRNQGFDRAHSEMGTYLYGGKYAGPFVEHLEE